MVCNEKKILYKLTKKVLISLKFVIMPLWMTMNSKHNHCRNEILITTTIINPPPQDNWSMITIALAKKYHFLWRIDEDGC